jgi:hypothetical protein
MPWMLEDLGKVMEQQDQVLGKVIAAISLQVIHKAMALDVSLLQSA